MSVNAENLFCLSVGAFALPVPRKGSIDALSGFGNSAEMGAELHRQIQVARGIEFKNYASEVKIAWTFEREGRAFEIGGRMDGVFAADVENDPTDLPQIEEIKSSFNVYDLARKLKAAGDEHPYILQLKTYGYFYWLTHKILPKLTLHLVSARNGETLDMNVSLYIEDYERWLELRLQELVEDAALFEKREARRRKAAKAFVFPFESPRSGQIELISTIEDGMRENRPMLVQAPTGLGKTIGVLYPVMQEALARGQQSLYVTPKNSQHSVAENAVEKLQESGASIKSLSLTAKSKLCMKNEPLCNPEYCEYAKDHYTKVAQHKLADNLSKRRLMKSRTFKKLATKYEVCPFELQLEAAHNVDLVICDYNYVFSPSSPLTRAGTSGGVGTSFQHDGKPNLVIDEAHNLPSRAMDYYSPSISTDTLERMREDVKSLPVKFRMEADALLVQCIQVVKSSGPKDAQGPQKIDPPRSGFLEQDVLLRTFLSTYLKADVEIQPRDVVLRLSYYWSEFTQALEYVHGGERKEFFTTFHPSPATIKIVCCDASEMLKACYDKYAQVVGFSATLKPFDFYSRLSGLAEHNLKTAEFFSPFPRSNRKFLVIPQISSKYSERQRNYPRVAETIFKISAVKRGNYFAFFPSFEFMERVYALFTAPEGFTAVKQQRHMRRDDIDGLIESLKERESARIVFAVQGGVFSEGVDYPGDMAIGAFIVGPPLPSFDLEREKMREYYQESYAAGFDYAYTFPAMAKAVQAAGRVIRSETDQGIIVLMDNRFIQNSFAKSMPQDWFDESPQELVSSSILKDVELFWQNAQESVLEI